MKKYLIFGSLCLFSLYLFAGSIGNGTADNISLPSQNNAKTTLANTFSEKQTFPIGVFTNSVLIKTNSSALSGAIIIKSDTTTNSAVRFGEDTYFYRTAANTITYSGNIISLANIYAGNLLADSYSLRVTNAKWTFNNAAGTCIYSVTNAAGTIIYGTGASSATSTNAFKLDSGTNRMTFSSPVMIITNLPTAPAGLPIGALWLSGSNVIMNLIAP